MLSLALVTILLSILLPLFRNLQTKNDVNLGSATIAQALRRTQSLAQAAQNDSAWGAHLATGTITIFKGTLWSGHDTNFDETINFSPGIAISGANDIIFNKFSGDPVSAGTITLTSLSNETASIIINSQGTVSY